MTDRKYPPRIVAAAAGFLCLLVYLRTLSCGFVNFDDPLYVLNNGMIRELDTELLAKAFGGSHAGFWMPLTWISLALDYHFWGLNPLGYHLTNIVLHAVNTMLVVLIADSLMQQRQVPEINCSKTVLPDSPRAGTVGDGVKYPLILLLAGLMWGIHPLRVESVAWVTERKDVLNGLFALSSVLCYLAYVRARLAGKPFRSAWLLSLLLFACSLMAKSVSVVLPVVLLVLDFYPLERAGRESIGRLIVEKAPFLLLSLLMSILTVALVADSNVLVPYDVFPLGQRLLVSGNAVFHYCRLLLFPLGILPLYPFPGQLPLSFTLATIITVVTLGACLAVVRARPWITALALCFLLPLLPALALFQNGDQIMAARFTYLPSVAPCVAVAMVLCAKAGKTGVWQQRALAAAFATLLLIYAGISFHLIGYWKDTGSYWSRMIELKPIGRAYSDRGRFYLEKGRYAEAVDDLGRAAEIASSVGMPEVFNLYAIRGEALARLGRHEEAVLDFTNAISLFPAPAYFHHRGLSLMALGRKTEGEDDLRRGAAEPGPIRWYKAE